MAEPEEGSVTGAERSDPPQLTFSSFSPENDSLRGVGGWLVLLVVTIALRSALDIIEAVHYWRWNPLGPSIFVAVMALLVSIPGVFTCVMLLRQEPGADRIAIGWLILNLAVVGFYLLVPLVNGRIVDLLNLARSAILTSLWVAYLLRSERVRVTYRFPSRRRGEEAGAVG